MKNNNNALIISILVGCFAIASAIIFYAIQTSPKSDQAPQAQRNIEVIKNVSVDDDAVLGDPNAPVTLIEFSDYNCGFCKKHFTNTLPLIKEKYIDTGKVKMVFRDAAYFGENSIALANAASCAQKIGGNEAYYKIHSEIFSGNKNFDSLIEIGTEFGLDNSKFNNCIKSRENINEVLLDTQDAKNYGVSGTPGFFINGVKVSGALPFNEFERIIESQLSQLNN